MLLIKTVYGEAANCSEASWEAIANVIMNRVSTREWKKYGTVTDVIKIAVLMHIPILMILIKLQKSI